jgi:hypothetical protein
MNIPIKYLPYRLSRKDKKLQLKQLKASRNAYKKNSYLTRKKLVSYKSKKSNHLLKAQKLYNVKNMIINSNLATATGCSKNALHKIVKKGRGAYYSSGSRPNQTAHSWGYARLASAISGGKASAVDYKILEDGCCANSKALKLARMAKQKHNYGTRKVPKIRI